MQLERWQFPTSRESDSNHQSAAAAVSIAEGTRVIRHHHLLLSTLDRVNITAQQV
jgi:hypothetical protein